MDHCSWVPDVAKAETWSWGPRPDDPSAVAELLAKLSADVARARDESELLAIAVRRTAQLTDSVRSSVALVDPLERAFQVYVLTEDESRTLPVGSALALAGSSIGVAVAEKRLVRSDLATGLSDVKALAQKGIVEVMNAPLVVRGEVVGTLNVGTDDPTRWTRATERLFEHWARTLSFGLEIRRAIESSHRSLKRANGLVEGLRQLSVFGYALQRATTDTQAFQLAGDLVVNAIPQTTRTSFVLVESNRREGRIVAVNGKKLDEAPVVALQGSPLGAAIVQRRAVYTHDFTQGEFASPMLVRLGVMSGVTAPIVNGETVLGVLNVGGEQVDAFDERDTEILANAASLLGARLVNLGLTEEKAQAAHNLARLLDGLPDAVCVVEDGIIRYANRPLRAQLGYQEAEAIGLPVEQLGDLDDLLSSAGDPRIPTEHVVSKKDGTSVLAAVTRVPVVYDGRESTALVIRDVTAHQEMERQLRLTERLASLGTMSAGIAHEINNPLAFLKGNLDYLEEKLAGPVSAEEWRAFQEIVGECREGTDRIQRIVADLKSHSRPGDSALVRVQIGDVLDSALRMVDHTVRHNAAIEVSVDELPDVMGEPSRMEQIFVNLLNNAAQSMPDRERHHNLIRVQACRHDTGGVCVTISDTGRGIPRDKLTRVFDPFYTTKRIGEGTGLGLFITQGIVRSFGGTIAVESELGLGTALRIWFPEAEMRRGPTGDASLKPTAEPHLQGKILVIDDEAAMCRAIRRILGSHHEVHTTTSPSEALAILGEDPSYKVVICDVMMPEMSGRRVYNAIQELNPDLASRVIFVTGGAFTEDASEFLDSTASPVLRKPFGVVELRQIVGAMLASSAPST